MKKIQTRMAQGLFPLVLLYLMTFLAAPATAVGDDAAPYRLTSGDRVRVVVFGHEDLSGEFEVDRSGDIALPLVNEVRADGLTRDQLEEAIIDALRPDYLVNPRVSVDVLSFRPVYVLGEVSDPGSYPFVSGMTVVNAIAEAGGFTYRAKKSRIRIVRETDEGSQELPGELSTMVQPGDVIEVPERIF